MADTFDREGYARRLIEDGVDETLAYEVANRMAENKTRGEPPLVVVETSQVAAEPTPDRRGWKRANKLIEEALAIEAEAAADAGAVGYMARVLVQATMPHRAAEGNTFMRKNGTLSVALMAHPDSGLPYGSYPRLLLAWLTTEAVRTKNSVLELGPSLSGFMHELGLIPAGGRWGTIHRLRDQMTRLFSTSVACRYQDEEKNAGLNLIIAKHYDLWWNPKSPKQAALWRSTVTLSEDFFREIIDRPVPIDIRALKALKQSPIALDTYCWLTYRMSYLKKPVEIPWEGLQMQFGADYGRLRDFKAAFLKQLRAVQAVYADAQMDEGKRGLILKPSRTHVQPPRSRPSLPPNKK